MASFCSHIKQADAIKRGKKKRKMTNLTTSRGPRPSSVPSLSSLITLFFSQPSRPLLFLPLAVLPFLSPRGPCLGLLPPPSPFRHCFLGSYIGDTGLEKGARGEFLNPSKTPPFAPLLLPLFPPPPPRIKMWRDLCRA
jgi:hypothetical protein